MDDQKKITGNDINEVSVKPSDSVAACGPGCDCNTPAKGSRPKMLVSLVVMAAVIGILAYKAVASRQVDVGSGTANFESAVAFGATSSNNLGSFGELNTVAMDKDAVFVYIPNKKGGNVSDATKNAVLSAQKTLGSKGTRVGLFALKTSSPDYAGISSQVEVPAVLVVIKGKGMSVVSGEASESGILQAFVASSRASGCGGAASCAPGAPGCK